MMIVESTEGFNKKAEHFARYFQFFVHILILSHNNDSLCHFLSELNGKEIIMIKYWHLNLSAEELFLVCNIKSSRGESAKLHLIL